MQAIRDEWSDLESDIEYNDRDSGYKVFYPCIWLASDALSEVTRHGADVRSLKRVRNFAPMPIHYGFLKRMGVNVKRVTKQPDYMNCYAFAIVEHTKKYGIMKRKKLTEEMVASSSLKDPKRLAQIDKIGLSIEDTEWFLDNEVTDFNVYAYDQHGNLVWNTEHKSTHHPPLMFVAHDAHVYVITDKSVRHSLMQSFRARSNPNKSSMFAQNAERAAKAEAALVEQLQRPHHVVDWSDSEPVDNLVETLDELSNCNVFFNQSNLHNLLIKLFQAQNYVHVAKCQYSGFVRIDYFNDVTIWANPNSTVNSPKLGLSGTSMMSRVVCSRLGVSFKNQSIGSATGQFYEEYYHPTGDRMEGIMRQRRDATERLRLGQKCGWVCGICMEKVDPTENFEIDHIKRWELSHDDSDNNLQLTHKVCHATKSAAEGGERVFKKDRTLSHFNAETLEIFNQPKNAMIHNFIPYERYSRLLDQPTNFINRDGTQRMGKRLQIKQGIYLAGLDLVKCRTHILQYGMLKNEFPDFSFLDQACKFEWAKHKEFFAGIYFIVVDTPLSKKWMPKGNGWYTHVEAEYLVTSRKVLKRQITTVVLATLTHPGNYYAPFVHNLKERLIRSTEGSNNYEREVFVAKNCINQWVGRLGIRSDDHKEVQIYSSIEAAATETNLRTEGSSTAKTTTRKTHVARKDGSNTMLFPRVFHSGDINNYGADGSLKRHDYIEAVITNTKVKQESYVPVFQTILGAECVNLWRTMEILEKFGGRICHVNTDNAVAIFDSQEQIDEMWAYARELTWDEQGKVQKYKRSDMPSANCVTHNETFDEEVFELTKPEWNIIPDPGHNDFKSVATGIVDQIVAADGFASAYD